MSGSTALLSSKSFRRIKLNTREQFSSRDSKWFGLSDNLKELWREELWGMVSSYALSIFLDVWVGHGVGKKCPINTHKKKEWIWLVMTLNNSAFHFHHIQINVQLMKMFLGTGKGHNSYINLIESNYFKCLSLFLFSVFLSFFVLSDLMQLEEDKGRPV